MRVFLLEVDDAGLNKDLNGISSILDVVVQYVDRRGEIVPGHLQGSQAERTVSDNAPVFAVGCNQLIMPEGRFGKSKMLFCGSTGLWFWLGFGSQDARVTRPNCRDDQPRSHPISWASVTIHPGNGITLQSKASKNTGRSIVPVQLCEKVRPHPFFVHLSNPADRLSGLLLGEFAILEV